MLFIGIILPLNESSIAKIGEFFISLTHTELLVPSRTTSSAPELIVTPVHIAMDMHLIHRVFDDSVLRNVLRTH